MKWLKDKWLWMTKLRHKQVMIEIMQEDHERLEKSTKDWQEIFRLKEEYYEALHEQTKELYAKDLMEKLEETESLVDTTLKELSQLTITRTLKPPFE